MIYPLVRELAAGGIAVAVTCRVLKIARQLYYRWVASPVSERAWEQAHLANKPRHRVPRRLAPTQTEAH